MSKREVRILCDRAFEVPDCGVDPVRILEVHQMPHSGQVVGVGRCISCRTEGPSLLQRGGVGVDLEQLEHQMEDLVLQEGDASISLDPRRLQYPLIRRVNELENHSSTSGGSRDDTRQDERCTEIDTGGLDRAGRDPARLDRLQAELAERDLVAARRDAADAAAVQLAPMEQEDWGE